jgi:hypothetical protein
MDFWWVGWFDTTDLSGVHSHPTRHTPIMASFQTHSHMSSSQGRRSCHTGATVSPKNNNASTNPATPTAPFRRPHEIPSGEPHPCELTTSEDQ